VIVCRCNWEGYTSGCSQRDDILDAAAKEHEDSIDSNTPSAEFGNWTINKYCSKNTRPCNPACAGISLDTSRLNELSCKKGYIFTNPAIFYDPVYMHGQLKQVYLGNRTLDDRLLGSSEKKMKGMFTAQQEAKKRLNSQRVTLNRMLTDFRGNKNESVDGNVQDSIDQLTKKSVYLQLWPFVNKYSPYELKTDKMLRDGASDPALSCPARNMKWHFNWSNHKWTYRRVDQDVCDKDTMNWLYQQTSDKSKICRSWDHCHTKGCPPEQSCRSASTRYRQKCGRHGCGHCQCRYDDPCN
jgi:hypothetical protein